MKITRRNVLVFVGTFCLLAGYVKIGAVALILAFKEHEDKGYT